MNELIAANNTALAARTPAVIAAEINSIKEQTRKIALYNSIEIGRRLTEAKSLIPHGDWGDWLEATVCYSQRTAENLMRIFEEYGSEQITLLSDNAKSQAIANLSYTQAVALLALPEEERDTFVQENDVESMTSRELQNAINDLKKAREDNAFIKEMWEKDREESLKKIQALETKLQDTGLSKKEKQEYEKKLSDEKANAIEKEVKLVEREVEIVEKDKLIMDIKKKNAEELKKSKKELSTLKEKIKELETKSLDVHTGATEEDISKAKAEAAEKYEKELAVLKVEKEQAEKRIKELEIKTTQQQNAAALKYKVYFDETVKNYQELLKALSELKETDPDAHERYKKAVVGLLEKMKERL